MIESAEGAMIESWPGAPDPEATSRVFYDIVQLLESPADPDANVVQVLARLRSLVPYEGCAVLDAFPGRAPRLLAPAETSPVEHARLMATLIPLLRLIEVQGRAFEVSSSPGAHLAAPLRVRGTLVGVLFVHGAEGTYNEGHARMLCVVAAQLGVYVSTLHARVRELEVAQKLEEAQHEGKAASRAKDEFLAMVSHELRTPLNTILAWADMLRSNEAGAPDRERAFQAIERSVRAQAKLIDDLLDLSSVTKAALRLDLRAVDPAHAVQAAILSLRPRADQKAIRLEVAIEESVMQLIADPKRLKQIVTGLVANAIKFTPSGGHVEVRLERDGELARLQVSDSGSGISPEILPVLFEPFRQADSSSTRAQGGLGVGLALVKDLVTLHGGNVRAESPGENDGSTFTVELPLAGVARQVAAAPQPLAKKAEDGRALTGIHVLLVDDDRDIREVLQFVLEGQGARVTVAASAAAALLELDRSMPHVLLSDIAMPGATGHDLMRNILAREGADAPPAAALSAYARAQDRRQATASGFRMLLEKPVDPVALIAAVVALAGTPPHGSGRRAARTPTWTS